MGVCRTEELRDRAFELRVESAEWLFLRRRNLISLTARSLISFVFPAAPPRSRQHTHHFGRRVIGQPPTAAVEAPHINVRQINYFFIFLFNCLFIVVCTMQPVYRNARSLQSSMFFSRRKIKVLVYYSHLVYFDTSYVCSQFFGMCAIELEEANSHEAKLIKTTIRAKTPSYGYVSVPSGGHCGCCCLTPAAAPPQAPAAAPPHPTPRAARAPCRQPRASAELIRSRLRLHLQSAPAAFSPK